MLCDPLWTWPSTFASGKLWEIDKYIVLPIYWKHFIFLVLVAKSKNLSDVPRTKGTDHARYTFGEGPGTLNEFHKSLTLCVGLSKVRYTSTGLQLDYYLNRELLNEPFRELLGLYSFGNELQTLLQFCAKKNPTTWLWNISNYYYTP